MVDLAALTKHWLQTVDENNDVDLNGNNAVNFIDFSIIAENFLKRTN